MVFSSPIPLSRESGSLAGLESVSLPRSAGYSHEDPNAAVKASPGNLKATCFELLAIFRKCYRKTVSMVLFNNTQQLETENTGGLTVLFGSL